jgi:hypothetical protein
MVSIAFYGNDAPDIADELTALLGRAVVARVATDVLLGELRARMREKGYAVSIDPIREPEP